MNALYYYVTHGLKWIENKFSVDCKMASNFYYTVTLSQAHIWFLEVTFVKDIGIRTCACVCVCMRARARVCVCVCVCVHAPEAIKN